MPFRRGWRQVDSWVFRLRRPQPSDPQNDNYPPLPAALRRWYNNLKLEQLRPRQWGTG
jgi:hypothetical protein